ncbi:MAG: SpoIIE family protein phosphatase [Deltaproteobacteria bacterium]
MNSMPRAPAKNKKRKLAFKLSLFILAGTTFIFLAAFGYNHYSSRKLVLKNVEENARNLTLATVNKIETTLLGVEKVPLYLASSLENHRYSRHEIFQTIEDILKTNPDIFGAAVAFEPFAFNPKSRYFVPYTFRKKDGFGVHPPETAFQYFYRDWYLIPRELGRPVWSEPYFSEGGGNTVMSTYSVPFYRFVNGKRTFTGVVEVDIDLEWLKEIISRVSIYQSGYAFLVSQNGVIVTHPNRDWIMRESIFSIAEAADDPGLRKMGRDMIRGKEGFIPLQSHFTGKKSWIYYAPLTSIGWSIGVVFPEEELFAGMKKLNREVFIIGSAGFVLLFLVIAWISNRMTAPIRTLSLKTAEIAKGNLDIKLPSVTSNDEIGELTASFEDMRLALKEYIFTLRETTAAKERLESELQIAHTIQMSFLPKRFPFFPEKDEFEIYATMEPAREVGGDLYDFFLVDEDYLFFSIGDVSGKGVPAALFMAVTKTLMKGIASKSMDLPEVLGKVNAELCLDNDAMMFCTLFCGFLNIRTGEFLYSNAGHNPPIVIRSGHKPRWLDLPEGSAMGVDEDAFYLTEKITLNSGDTLILYTDGVTEATDHDKSLYSTDRLIDTIEKSKLSSIEPLVLEIMNSVRDFTGGEPQSDDITILAVRFGDTSGSS